MSLFHGVDIEDLERWKRLCDNPRWQGFIRRYFFDGEWNYAWSRAPHRHLAVRWCAKEAMLKAALSLCPGLNLQHIEVILTQEGQPLLKMHHPDWHHDRWQVSLSLSHSHQSAIASVVVWGGYTAFPA